MTLAPAGVINPDSHNFAATLVRAEAPVLKNALSLWAPLGEGLALNSPSTGRAPSKFHKSNKVNDREIAVAICGWIW